MINNGDWEAVSPASGFGYRYNSEAEEEKNVNYCTPIFEYINVNYL